MRVVNFAHGEFLMLGMYAAFWAFTLLHADPYVTLLVALPLFFLVGWGSYALIMRPIVHTSHNVQVFTTVGLSIVLQNLALDRKSTRLNSSHGYISYAVFCLKKKKTQEFDNR